MSINNKVLHWRRVQSFKNPLAFIPQVETGPLLLFLSFFKKVFRITESVHYCLSFITCLVLSILKYNIGSVRKPAVSADSSGMSGDSDADYDYVPEKKTKNDAFPMSSASKYNKAMV